MHNLIQEWDVQMITQQIRYNDHCLLSEWSKMGQKDIVINHITHQFLTNQCLLIYTQTTELIELRCLKS